MLLTILKELNKRHRQRKHHKREKRAKKLAAKVAKAETAMSFNRDLGFRYLSSTSPQSREGSEALRRRFTQQQGRLHRSQSELTLNNIDNITEKSQLFGSDNLSDVGGEPRIAYTARSVPPTSRLRNRSLIHGSSLHEDESEDQHEEENHQKRFKSKKKAKKHKRAIAPPNYTQQLSTSSVSGWDSNNNATDSSPPIKDKDAVPNNWMPLFLPSYKSRLSKFQRTFEEIPPNEKLVDDYVCALRKDILLQGRLYISVNYIAFHSNILVYETHLIIKFSEITKIAKATTMKVFPNAIEIHTTSGEKHILTSFVSRERAFALMLKLWQSSRDGDAGTEKITWTEICKYIRNSYITDTLTRDLSELDEVDLEDLLKGKSVKKKLQTKKEKLKLLEVERTHHRSDSTASFLSAFEDLPDDSSNETDKPTTDKHPSAVLTSGVEDSTISKVTDSIRTVLPGVIGEGLADCVQYCADERNVVRVCVIVSVLLLIVQLSLLCWVSVFESKINNYEKILIDSLAAKRAALQQHSILTDSV